jgi:hypothetical protein
MFVLLGWVSGLRATGHVSPAHAPGPSHPRFGLDTRMWPPADSDKARAPADKRTPYAGEGPDLLFVGEGCLLTPDTGLTESPTR